MSPPGEWPLVLRVEMVSFPTWSWAPGSMGSVWGMSSSLLMRVFRFGKDFWIF